ncbi:unnamed protein product [Acidithrix sp. C25]|nr:unnamed protein product [Acidithrix sp. C25]
MRIIPNDLEIFVSQVVTFVAKFQRGWGSQTKAERERTQVLGARAICS